MAAPGFLWKAASNTAQLSTVLQILLFLPLTLATLSKQAFLVLSLLLFTHSLIHGTMLLLWRNPMLSFLQVPMHPFLLLLCFNVFSQSAPAGVEALVVASRWWGVFLRWSSPGFVVMEGLSSLLIAQKLGRFGRELAGEGEAYQLGLVVASAFAYVASAWRIGASFPSVASSPLSSTLLGVTMTAFIFLTIIGFNLRRTNVIESSALALFLAYNLWLCGLDVGSYSEASSEYAYAPLLSNILPHFQALINFVTNTLPKPVLFALIYRLTVLHLASRILPTIGADSWDADDGVDEGWNERPTSKLTHILLTYRQAVLVTVYSSLLLLDQPAQVWWRWMNISLTLIIWAIEIVVTGDDDPLGDKWKVE